MSSIKVCLPPTTRIIYILAIIFWSYADGYPQKEIPVPEFYGAYFVSDGKLTSTKDAFDEKRLKTVGDLYSNKTGIKKLSGISLAANDYIVMYDKDVSFLLSLLKLGKFKFVKEMELGIWPNRKLYQMNYWIFEKNVPMNIGPVKGQPDLYRMVPKTSLSDGVYAVYYNIESVMSSDKRLVLDFVVGKVASAAVETGVTLNAERDALLRDVNNIASAATMYWRKPAALGGGMRTFVGVDFVKIGVDASNANGKFVMSNITTNQFTLTATGAKYRVVIVATITQQGISGKPMITDGVSGFTSEKSSEITESLNLVKNSWTHVEYVLQRRSDLIPNLLDIVKRYINMTREERILISTVSEARKVTVRKEGTQTEIIKMYNIIERGLARLLIIAENYPNLKADPSFIRLQEELKNIRDRLETAKRRYNHAVHTYNEMIASAPSDILSRYPQFKPAITFDSQ